MNKDSSVVAATKLRAGGYEVPIPAEAKVLLFATTSTPALKPAQPPIQWVKRMERDVGH
jgi:hypothetical protein